MSCPKFSIIVPVYKTEKYLHRCVDSILAQTFTDFEVLLVDDGSPDGAGKICDEYVQKDSRIQVFHKQNGGVSSARNLGLDNAIGERIIFVDSDDWLSASYLESFLLEDADIVVQGFRAKNWPFKTTDSHGDWVDVITESVVGERNSISSFILKLSEIHNLGYLWCRSFNRRLIENFNIRFNPSYKLREDEEFIFRYLLCIKNYAIVENIGYNYIAPDFSKYNSLNLDIQFDCLESIIKSMVNLGLKANHPATMSMVNEIGTCLFSKYQRGFCDFEKMNNQLDVFRSYCEELKIPSSKMCKKCLLIRMVTPFRKCAICHQCLSFLLKKYSN